MNKRSLEGWKLCRHNDGHHSKADTSISDIVEMKEMDEIPLQEHIETRWIDLYPQDDTRMTQMFSFYVPVFTSV